jgi:hypothetical protein
MLPLALEPAWAEALEAMLPQVLVATPTAVHLEASVLA